MQLTVRTPDHRVHVDIDVAIRDPLATVGSLITALGMSDEHVTIDGRRVATTTLIADAELFRGSTIVVGGRDTTPAGTVSLLQVGGIDAGWEEVLGVGDHQLHVVAQRHGVPFDQGQPIAHLYVGSDGRVTLTPEFAGLSLNWAPLTAPTPWTQGQVLFAGGRLFRLEYRAPHVRQRLAVTDAGMVPIMRPARVPPRAKPGAIAVPDVTVQKPTPRKLPLVTMLAPLPIAGAMAAMMGPRALLFGVLTPVMTIASFFEDKRQAKATAKTDAAAVAEAEATVLESIDELLFEESARLHEAYPDIAHIVRRGVERQPTLWQRRLSDADALAITVGSADQRPPVTFENRSTKALDLEAIKDAAPMLTMAPVAVELKSGRGIGFAGDHQATVAAAWAVIAQLVVQHGPADIQITVFTTPEKLHAWEAVKWLPHALDKDGRPRVQLAVNDARARLNEIIPPSKDDKPQFSFQKSTELTAPVWLVITDDALHHRGREAPLRKLLAEPQSSVRVLVLSENVTDLPAVCTTVVELARMQSRTDGGNVLAAPVLATVNTPVERSSVGRVIVNGLSPVVVDELVHALASSEDPEHVVSSGAGLPTSVALPPLLGFSAPEGAVDVETADELAERIEHTYAQRWRATKVFPARGPIGVSTTGVTELDVLADGPHGLMAGTTGAGKSELLRSVVAALAAAVPPDQLTFLLVDYKGGSAFDACASLPHIVGMVTDLDEHLSARVLRSLQAEIRHRERLLRQLGATDIDQLLATCAEKGVRSPLPRLLLVVDEFATLAAELPDFMPSLVDVAQRGRSLGMNMILATQRPQGVLDNKIKANTNLRVALRVQDDTDSTDVIGTKAAALIPRGLPGRGLIRRGAGELLEFQAAQATRPFESGVIEERLELHPFLSIGNPLEGLTKRAPSASSETDLDIIVRGLTKAWESFGVAPQRRPYLEPLPEDLGLANVLERGLAAPADGIPVGVVDEPDEQRQSVTRVELGPGGNIIAFGLTGSGTTTFLRAVALSAANASSPNDLHIYALDADSGGLAPLSQLPHFGGMAGLDDLGKVGRLLRVVTGEVDRRRRLAANIGADSVRATEPTILVLVDNVVSLRQAFQDDLRFDALSGILDSLARDGSSLGVVLAVSAPSERGVGTALLTALPKRFVFKLSDSSAYMSFGVRAKAVPDLKPGRCLVVETEPALEMQVGNNDGDDVTAAATRWESTSIERPPEMVTTIASTVTEDEVRSVFASWEAPPPAHSIPLGIDVDSGKVRFVRLGPGENFLIAGPARSGKSTVVRQLVERFKLVDSSARIAILCPRPSPLRDVDDSVGWVTSDLSELPTWEKIVLGNAGRRIVVVDDADRLPTGALEAFATANSDDMSIIAVARTESYRGFGFWAKALSTSRNGLVMRPTSADGDILRVNFPARMPTLLPCDVAHVDDGAVGYVRTVIVE